MRLTLHESATILASFLEAESEMHLILNRPPRQQMPIPDAVDINIAGELCIVRILRQESSAQLPIRELGRHFCSNS
jgi:hypothetical protein